MNRCMTHTCTFAFGRTLFPPPVSHSDRIVTEPNRNAIYYCNERTLFVNARPTQQRFHVIGAVVSADAIERIPTLYGSRLFHGASVTAVRRDVLR